MSKRSDLLVACLLGNRWQASNVTAGASCAAASPIAGVNSRIHLETILLTVRNLGGAALHTISAEVRGSLGNTVLWHAEMLVPSTTQAQISQSNLAFAAPKKGTGVIVAFNTAASSVSYAINAAGWIEDTNG